MIDRFAVRQNYLNKPIKITLTNGIVLYGVIIDDSVDYCQFVKTVKFVSYRLTKNESLVERIYFKDMKSVDYQKK